MNDVLSRIGIQEVLSTTRIGDDEYLVSRKPGFARIYSHVDCQREFDVKDWIDHNPTRRSPTLCSYSALLLLQPSVCAPPPVTGQSLSARTTCAPPVPSIALGLSLFLRRLPSNQKSINALSNQSCAPFNQKSINALSNQGIIVSCSCVVFVRSSSLSLSLCFASVYALVVV